jgi:hypothetical protein
MTISYSDYQASASGGLVTLKDPGGGGTTGNYGLIDINGSTGSDICPYMRGGSTKAITDPGTYTETGNPSGLARCIRDRKSPAVANSCYTASDVLDSNGKLKDRCNPLIGAARGANGYSGIQATAVILIPITTNASFDPSGHKAISLQQVGGGVRLFAFFLVDRSTFESTEGGPYCGEHGNCDIRGRFVQSYGTAVLPSGSTTTGPYSASGVAKVIELTE